MSYYRATLWNSSSCYLYVINLACVPVLDSVYPSPPALSRSLSPWTVVHVLQWEEVHVRGAPSSVRGCPATVNYRPASPSPPWLLGHPRRSVHSERALCLRLETLLWTPWKQNNQGAETPEPTLAGWNGKISISLSTNDYEAGHFNCS